MTGHGAHAAAGLSAAQITRAFRDTIVPPPARLRTRATRGGYEVEIPSASAGYAGIHPRNDPARQRQDADYWEACWSRMGVPVTIQSLTLLRGGRTVRVTVGPARNRTA